MRHLLVRAAITLPLISLAPPGQLRLNERSPGGRQRTNLLRFSSSRCMASNANDPSWADRHSLYTWTKGRWIGALAGPFNSVNSRFGIFHRRRGGRCWRFGCRSAD